MSWIQTAYLIALGVGLYGSVYVMPVFLAAMHGHSALAIGEIMLVTGTAQLLTARVADALERRYSLLMTAGPAALNDPIVQSLLETLIEKAALVETSNLA